VENGHMEDEAEDCMIMIIGKDGRQMGTGSGSCPMIGSSVSPC
jgi:hypothetical protein